MESTTPSLFFFLSFSLSLFESFLFLSVCVCVEYHIEFHFFSVSILPLPAFIFWSRLFFEGIILSISSGVFLGFYILLSLFTQPISSLLEKQKKFLKNREAET